MATKDVITSDAAPAAIGSYSPALRVAELVFVSGQIPLDPATGQLVTGDIAAETRRVMDNLGALLEAAGVSFDHVVKTTIYLLNLADFSEVNAVYASYFDAAPPARATIQVAALPKGARVEIDAIAYAPSS
jgi:2-iminobutanoate/2-iminopropanoate deaminase